MALTTDFRTGVANPGTSIFVLDLSGFWYSWRDGAWFIGAKAKLCSEGQQYQRHGEKSPGPIDSEAGQPMHRVTRRGAGYAKDPRSSIPL